MERGICNRRSAVTRQMPSSVTHGQRQILDAQMNEIGQECWSYPVVRVTDGKHPHAKIFVFWSKGEWCACIDDIPTPTLTFANVNDIHYSLQWILLTSLPPLFANVTDINSLHSPIWQYLACCGHWTKSLNRLVKPLTASLNRHVEPLTASHLL